MNEPYRVAELHELALDLRKLSHKYNVTFTVHDCSETSDDSVAPRYSGADLNTQNVPLYCLRGNMAPMGPRIGTMELGNEKNRDECGWVRLSDFEAVVKERDKLKALLSHYQEVR